MSFGGDTSCGALDWRKSRAPAWRELLGEVGRALEALSGQAVRYDEPTAVVTAAATSAATKLAEGDAAAGESAALPSALSVDLLDINNALRGDDQAYARLIRRYQGQIASQVWRASRRLGDCEELVQEVFVEAYLSLGKFRARSPFLHWLRKITTRVCYRYWKRQARLRRHTSLSDTQWNRIALDGSAASRADQAADVVHDLLSKLSPRDRLVMTLVFLEDCSVREAAELTGWSRTMVKVQCFRARRKLQALLTETAGNETAGNKAVLKEAALNEAAP